MGDAAFQKKRVGKMGDVDHRVRGDDGRGREPVAVDVYLGDATDPATVPDQVERLERQFGLSRVVLVRDGGVLTGRQVEHLEEHPGWGGFRRRMPCATTD